MPVIEVTATAFGELKDGATYPTLVQTCHTLQHSLVDLDMGKGIRGVSCGICGYDYTYNAKLLKTGLKGN